MDLSNLLAGNKVRTVDGHVVEILAPSEDGQWIRVRYIESRDNPELVGTEDLCSEDELATGIGNESGTN